MSIRILRGSALLLVGLGLAACQTTTDGVPLVADAYDRGFFDRSGHLSNMEAGIWVDPDGCHVWIIDDGAEGYMSRRRDPRSGLPVCVPIAEPGQIVGDFRRSSRGVIEFNPGSGV